MKPALTPTFSQFRRTQEGQTILASGTDNPAGLFVIEGQLWQGFGNDGQAVQVRPTQPTLEEIEAAHDIDGTKHKVLKTLADREAGRQTRKEQELAERRQRRAQAELAVLQLDQLKAQLSGTSGQKDEKISKIKELIETAEGKHVPQLATCEVCDAVSPKDHKNPKMWLRGHMVHHKGRRGKRRHDDRGTA